MDWPNKIAELRAAGMRQGDIAVAVGVSQSVISDLEHGRQKSVGWEIGERILALHLLHVGRQAA